MTPPSGTYRPDNQTFDDFAVHPGMHSKTFKALWNRGMGARMG